MQTNSAMSDISCGQVGQQTQSTAEKALTNVKHGRQRLGIDELSSAGSTCCGIQSIRSDADVFAGCRVDILPGGNQYQNLKPQDCERDHSTTMMLWM